MQNENAAHLDRWCYAILSLVLSLVAIYPAQTKAADLVEQCNIAAGSPYEPKNLGAGRGVDLRDVDWGLFVSSCLALYRSDAPKTPELLYRFARGYYGRFLNGNTCRDISGFEKAYADAAAHGYAPAQHDLGLLNLNGHCVQRDLEAAAQWFRSAAEQDFPPSQHILATLYLAGDGVPEDPVEAAKWLRAAVDNGYADSQIELAQLYQIGRGVAIDVVRARVLLEAAAAQGSQQALAALARLEPPDEAREQELLGRFRLGLRHVRGDGVSKDPQKGVTLIAEAARAGFAEAQFALATLYNGGLGVEANQSEMTYWLTAAANQDYVPAQTRLGKLLWDTAVAEQSTNVSRYDEAHAWLLKAAEHGDPYAQYLLAGTSVLYGRNDEAVKWYTKSAEQDFVFAQSALGVLLFGNSGPSPDDEAAVQWLRLAAGAGEPLAMTYLGYAHQAGRGGLMKNPQEAVQLWTKAAEQANARAEEALGHAYEHGLGVPRDLAAAQSWYRRAASHGSEGASSALETPAMAEIASPDMGTAVLLGLLVLMAAAAGDDDGYAPLPEVRTYSDTVGDTMFDMRDPMQFWGTMMMME